MRWKGSRTAVVVAVIVSGGAGLAWGQPQNLPTNINNYFIRGTQPNQLAANGEILSANQCAGCHEIGSGAPIFNDWSGSLMSQAARDPVMYACLDIANHDAPGIGDTCLRCHVPKGWLEGRSTPTDGSALTVEDRDGINCNFCHRLVDPFAKPGAPPVDGGILAALGVNAPAQSADLGVPSMPGDNGMGGYVIDPHDQRRGPRPIVSYDDWVNGVPLDPAAACCDFFHIIEGAGTTYTSALHRRADICSTCHDVSFGHLMRQPDGSYSFNGTGVHHPTGNKYDMIPEQRTYSEWLKSTFASTGVDMGGRFGGLNNPIIRDCQDCHMPVDDVQACLEERSQRLNTRRHYFSGASTWVLDAIGAYYGPNGAFPVPDLDESDMAALAANKARNIDMLHRSADLAAVKTTSPMSGDPALRVRVTNQTGHKLPTGYPEGRRVFLNVQYFSFTDPVHPLVEFGAYDLESATLDSATTKVYEAVFGLDSAIATALNRPAGPSSHAAFANKVYKDNRIPPRGFTNANFAAVQASPVAYSYADGQYWDDTYYPIPAGGCTATTTLYYQATSREYAEFLRDNNPAHGTDPNNRGELMYQLWAGFGFGEPVTMATQSVDLILRGDADLNGVVSASDIPQFVSVLLGLVSDPQRLCAVDCDRNGVIDGRDVQPFVGLLVP